MGNRKGLHVKASGESSGRGWGQAGSPAGNLPLRLPTRGKVGTDQQAHLLALRPQAPPAAPGPFPANKSAALAAPPCCETTALRNTPQLFNMGTGVGMTRKGAQGQQLCL